MAAKSTPLILSKPGIPPTPGQVESLLEIMTSDWIGVILAASVILYGLVFGLEAAKRVVRPALVETLGAVGVLLYAGVGVAAMLRGGNFLDYSVLGHDPAHGQHLGILLVELGVLTTVASVMIAIFSSFAGRGRPR